MNMVREVGKDENVGHVQELKEDFTLKFQKESENEEQWTLWIHQSHISRLHRMFSLFFMGTFADTYLRCGCCKRILFAQWDVGGIVVGIAAFHLPKVLGHLYSAFSLCIHTGAKRSGGRLCKQQSEWECCCFNLEIPMQAMLVSFFIFNSN